MRAGENRSRKTANALSSQPVVFISYSSEDRVIAEKVCRLLEGDGLPCWIAPRDVAPGHDFGEQIIDAIESTQVMVLILSAHANASIFVKREVERAISAGRVAIPLRIQEVQPSKALQLFISSTQWIDAWAPPLPARVHLLAAELRDLLQRAQAEREVGVESAAQFAHEPRAQQQLVRGDLGVGRAFLEGGNEKFGPEFHEAPVREQPPERDAN